MFQYFELTNSAAMNVIFILLGFCIRGKFLKVDLLDKKSFPQLSAQVLEGFRVYPPQNSEGRADPCPGIFPPAHASAAVPGSGVGVEVKQSAL